MQVLEHCPCQHTESMRVELIFQLVRVRRQISIGA